MKKYTVPTFIIAMLFIFTLLAGVSEADWTDKWWDDVESYTKKKVSEMPYPAISNSIKNGYDRVRGAVKDLKDKGLVSFAKGDEESFKKEGNADDTRITKRSAGEYRPPQEKEDSLTKLLREAREEVEKQEPRQKVEVDFASEIAKFKREQEMLNEERDKITKRIQLVENYLVGEWRFDNNIYRSSSFKNGRVGIWENYRSYKIQRADGKLIGTFDVCMYGESGYGDTVTESGISCSIWKININNEGDKLIINFGTIMTHYDVNGQEIGKTEGDKLNPNEVKYEVNPFTNEVKLYWDYKKVK